MIHRGHPYDFRPSGHSQHHDETIPRIVSGGQSGTDRALDWALSHNLACGGWCPKGRKAEDGPINAKYPLKESSSASYLQPTERNVRDSDATILFSIAPTLSGGSKKTVEFTRKHNKPCVRIHAAMPDASQRLKTFLDDNVLNVLMSPVQEEAKSQSCRNS
jgi:hypothetical protein